MPFRDTKLTTIILPARIAWGEETPDEGYIEVGKYRSTVGCAKPRTAERTAGNRSVEGNVGRWRCRLGKGTQVAPEDALDTTTLEGQAQEGHHQHNRTRQPAFNFVFENAFDD